MTMNRGLHTDYHRRMRKCNNAKKQKRTRTRSALTRIADALERIAAKAESSTIFLPLAKEESCKPL